MIYYVVNGRGRSAINLLLLDWGRSLAGRVRVLDYAWLLRQRRLPLGTYIFTGTETLSPAEREKIALAWEALAASDAPLHLLNHPLRVMRRYEMLRTLFEAGRNPFDVYRLTEARQPRRFPVFLRREDDHAGPRSELLGDASVLARATEQLVSTGQDREGWLVAEYVDTRTVDGAFRKYGAFYIAGANNGTVIPRHVQTASDWMVKGTSREFAADNLKHEQAYVASNPHADQIRELFALARIDYGRIDYALGRDGRLVVFEINTNPQLAMPGPSGNSQRTSIKQVFAERLVQALSSIDSPSDGTVPVTYDIRSWWRRKPYVSEIVMSAMGRVGLQRLQPAVYAMLERLRSP